MTPLRPDLAIIADWVKNGSHVLDLGCGDGTLLRYLAENKNVTGYGIEIEIENICSCIENQVSVIQGDLDQGLSDFDDNTFDYVIMSQSLQALYFPDKILDEMLRVGKQGIISFPNMGHWRSRMQFFFKGHMPVTKGLPHQWYDTPNIHLCTIKDFKRLCIQKAIKVQKQETVDREHVGHFGMNIFPNLLAESALFQFEPK